MPGEGQTRGVIVARALDRVTPTFKASVKEARWTLKHQQLLYNRQTNHPDAIAAYLNKARAADRAVLEIHVTLPPH